MYSVVSSYTTYDTISGDPNGVRAAANHNNPSGIEVEIQNNTSHPIDVTVTPGSGGPGYPPIEKNSSLMQGLTVNPGKTRSLLFP